MAKTIKNDDFITINRKFTLDSGEVVEKEVQVGRYYFEASRDIKQCTLQLYFEEPITDEKEKQQIGEIYKRELDEFISDTNNYGWGEILKR